MTTNEFPEGMTKLDRSDLDPEVLAATRKHEHEVAMMQEDVGKAFEHVKQILDAVGDKPVLGIAFAIMMVDGQHSALLGEEHGMAYETDVDTVVVGLPQSVSELIVEIVQQATRALGGEELWP